MRDRTDLRDVRPDFRLIVLCSVEASQGDGLSVIVADLLHELFVNGVTRGIEERRGLRSGGARTRQENRAHVFPFQGIDAKMLRSPSVARR